MAEPTDERVRMPADPASVPQLRAVTRSWARELGLPGPQVSDLCLAVSEAASNAVLHAFVGREPGTVTLTLGTADGRAVVCVIDDGRGLMPRIDSPGLGLGLPTIGRLTDHLDVGPGPEGGTRVQMAFEAPGLASGADRRARLAASYDTLADAITVSDTAGVVHANPAAVAMLEAGTAEELAARPAGGTAARFRIVREDGSPVSLEEFPHRRLFAGEEDPAPLLTRSVNLADGRARWIETTARPLDDPSGPLVISVSRDVTEVTDAANRARFLAVAADRLARVHSEVEVAGAFAELAALAVPALTDWCAVDLVEDDGALHHVALAHRDPEQEARYAELRRRFGCDPASSAGIYAVVRSGQARFIPRFGAAELATLTDPEQRTALAALGLRSVLLAPMTGHDGVLGVLTLVTAESGRTLADDEVAFACDMARRAGAAVDDARRAA